MVVGAFPGLLSQCSNGCRHLMTGTGAYFYLVWGIWLRHCLNGRQDEYTMVWEGWTSLPVVVKRESVCVEVGASRGSLGHTSGSTKKKL